MQAMGANMVEYLRTYVYTVFGNAAGDVARLAESGCREPERFVEPRERYQEAALLLDTIGWDQAARTVDIELEVPRYARVLREAIDTARGVAEDKLRDLDESAPRGTDQQERETTLTEIHQLDELTLAVLAAAA